MVQDMINLDFDEKGRLGGFKFKARVRNYMLKF
jgi:hypothetical protein